MAPANALAAAVSGLAICVRMPGPCRPSKLRFVVLIVRLPGANPSPPAKKHNEQPLSRHSNPALRKI